MPNRRNSMQICWYVSIYYIIVVVAVVVQWCGNKAVDSQIESKVRSHREIKCCQRPKSQLSTYKQVHMLYHGMCLCSCMYSKRAKFGNTLLLFMVFENLRKIFKFSFFYVSQVPHMSFGRFEVLKESLKNSKKSLWVYY